MTSLASSGISASDPNVVTVRPPSGSEYLVDRNVLILLSNKPSPPSVLTEDQLIEMIYKDPEQNLRRTRGFNAEVLEHVGYCATTLADEVGPIKKREMIGELFAAMGLASTGLQMVWGYGGTGHTGLDQVWQMPGRIYVVEAKGGHGDLSNRPRYAEGTTHRGELGMNDAQETAQMSPAWVFRNANGTAGGAFTAAVINNFPIASLNSPFEDYPDAKKYALEICRLLWKPKPTLAAGFLGNPQLLVDPHLPQPVAFDPGDPGKIVRPTLHGITILNGIIPWTRVRDYSTEIAIL